MPTPFDLKQTDALLSTTRAVRKRLDLTKPVPREVILDCIRLSQQAPTGRNAQTWRTVRRARSTSSWRARAPTRAATRRRSASTTPPSG